MKKLNVLFGVFFCSGFAALAYQIYFAKKLALVFGSQSSATYTVLAIYMGGMALGAAIGARIARRTTRPVHLYAIAELIVALYCLFTPGIFSLAHDAYLVAADGIRPDSSRLVLYQILLGSLVLAVPTVLMGLTFPLLVRAASNLRSCLGSIAGFYSSNTFGAAVGALLAGYLLIPAIGMNGTLWLSTALDVLVAMVAFYIAGKDEVDSLDAAAAAAPVANEAVVANKADDDSARRLGLLVLFAVGAITLMMEVSTIHMLAVVIGNSAYAFSLMLSCFLGGLALGGRFAGRQAEKHAQATHHQRIRDGLSLLMFCILGSTFLWTAASAYFIMLAQMHVAHSFWLRELLRAIPAAVIIIPPAFAIGALYPVSMAAASGGRHDEIGFPSAINTLGNIVGVLLAGFILLPVIGGFQIALVCAAIVFVLLLATGASMMPGWSMIQRYGASAISLVFLLIAPKQLDLKLIATGTNVYFHLPYYLGWDVTDHAESADGGITAVMTHHDEKTNTDHKTLTTNGKFQGNNIMNDRSEMGPQLGYGLAPMRHLSNYDRALVIGYGTGVTSMVVHESGFKNLDVVDLSKDVVDIANRNFADVNQNVGEASGVSFYYTDGRNYLSLTKNRYDLISIQVSSIWFAGAASLYNREFYQLAASRLKDDGVLKQWFQLNHMSKANIHVILSSAAASFRHVWVYVVGSQGAIIASNSDHAFPSDDKNARLISMADNKVMKPYIDLYPKGVDTIKESLILQPDQVRRMLASHATALSDDNNLLLEYSTPKGNALHDAEFRDNLDYLKKFASL